MKTMKKGFIGADAATLAGLQIDLLQKVRSGQITFRQLEGFNNLSSADRDMLFSEGKRRKLALNDATLSRLKYTGYLDTSFKGKESHHLEIRPLTKGQALTEYHNSGGKTWVWDELRMNMPYSDPRTKTLNVMILNFRRNIGSDEVLAEMDKLGVRSITYEELIQYGITHPEHQKKNILIGLGTKHTWVGEPRAPIMDVVAGERSLIAVAWGRVWDDRCRFPVVRK